VWDALKDMFRSGPFLWPSKHPDPFPSPGPTKRRVEPKSTPESRKGTYIGDDPRFAAYWRRDKGGDIDWKKGLNEVWKATRAIGGETLKQAPVVLPVAGALGGGSGAPSGGDLPNHFIRERLVYGGLHGMNEEMLNAMIEDIKNGILSSKKTTYWTYQKEVAVKNYATNWCSCS